MAKPTSEEIEKLIEGLVKAVWGWGESCGVDNVGFSEHGDSHNAYMRNLAMTAKDKVYAMVNDLLDATDKLDQEESHAVARIRDARKHRAMLNQLVAAHKNHEWVVDCYGSHDVFYKCTGCPATSSDRHLPVASGVDPNYVIRRSNVP